jgi:hypothetical protein
MDDTNAFVSPADFLREINERILFRQGKRLGLRNNDIAYGARRDVDFLDVRRGYKALLGVPGALVEVSLEEWIRAVDCGPRLLNSAMILFLLMIAIHPFADGNGRAARLSFTWLLQRWRLPVLWLAEDISDGEFSRDGFGLASTEYLMMQAIADLGDGHNLIQPGLKERFDCFTGEEFVASIVQKLKSLCVQPANILELPSLSALVRHYIEHDHLVPFSPRFKSILN